MSAANVKNYLAKDIEHLNASYADANTRLQNNVSDFEDEMWKAWKRYYQRLRRVDERMIQKIDDGQPEKVKKALKWENRALELAISRLSELLSDPDTPRPAQRHLRALRNTLEIEAESNGLILDELDAA